MGSAGVLRQYRGNATAIPKNLDIHKFFFHNPLHLPDLTCRTCLTRIFHRTR